jgi:hypothetical protein
MANYLGSLSGGYVDESQATGMASATGFEGGNKPPTIVKGKLVPSQPEPKERIIPEPKTIPELIRDCEAALSNYEKHHAKRDCSALEGQIRSELLPQLLGHHVAREISAAMEVLRRHYDVRWHAKGHVRPDAHKFHSVAEARKCHLQLLQARSGADFLGVTKELLETCKISLGASPASES